MSEDISKKNKNEKEEILILVRKAKDGDNLAFDQIYQHHFTPLFRYVYFRSRNREDAEDLIQTVFLKCFKALPRFQEKENPFSSWLYKIARNTIIDYYRKKKDEILSNPIESLEKLKDTVSIGPTRLVEQTENKKIVQRVIEQLSKEQREVIILRFINDMSIQEIAKLLNKTREAVRALQYRGLKTLKEKFKKSNLL